MQKHIEGTDEELELAKRKKMNFNILENLKKRENKPSLLENSFLEKREKILKKKERIEKKHATSLSPVKPQKPK